jgi:hypothetical protein
MNSVAEPSNLEKVASAIEADAGEVLPVTQENINRAYNNCSLQSQGWRQ